MVGIASATPTMTTSQRAAAAAAGLESGGCGHRTPKIASNAIAASSDNASAVTNPRRQFSVMSKSGRACSALPTGGAFQLASIVKRASNARKRTSRRRHRNTAAMSAIDRMMLPVRAVPNSQSFVARCHDAPPEYGRNVARTALHISSGGAAHSRVTCEAFRRCFSVPASSEVTNGSRKIAVSASAMMPAPMAIAVGRHHSRRAANSSNNPNTPPVATMCSVVSGCPNTITSTKATVSSTNARRSRSRITRRTASNTSGSTVHVRPSGHPTLNAIALENVKPAVAISDARSEQPNSRAQPYVNSAQRKNVIDTPNVVAMSSGSSSAIRFSGSYGAA